jgi:hypothetical protein
VAQPQKPPLFYILAAFGLVLGLFGGMSAISNGLSLLMTRDEYVSATREGAEKLAPAAKDDVLHMVERQADAVYSRRNVALPLAAMNVILSGLLFLGCGRALRGQAWGISAWQLAAAASIPYTLLACAFALVQARELRTVFEETPGPLGALSGSILAMQRLLTLLKTTLELIYFAAVWLYLRRPAIRQLFSDGR